MSFEDILRNEINNGTDLEQAVRDIRAKIAREEAERIKKETTAKQITDIANRAINGETTANDVATLLGIYLTKEGTSADLVKDIATAEAVESICNVGTAVIAALEEVTKYASNKDKDTNNNFTMNDSDKVIRAFLNSL